MIGLPFQMLVEATGHPEAAARHALAGDRSKRHVLLVTKETDSVAGPMLARLARPNGVGITPVDGDQPALLIDLVTWAERSGFDILAPENRASTTSSSMPLPAAVAAMAMPPPCRPCGAWSPGRAALRDVAAGRAAILGRAYPLNAVPDLCEMTLVANACGFVADTPPFHAPVARIPEVAALLSSRAEHGLLAGDRRLDVFHHLRAPDEASFAGGVFITVALPGPGKLAGAGREGPCRQR